MKLFSCHLRKVIHKKNKVTLILMIITPHYVNFAHTVLMQNQFEFLIPKKTSLEIIEICHDIDFNEYEKMGLK